MSRRLFVEHACQRGWLFGNHWKTWLALAPMSRAVEDGQVPSVLTQRNPFPSVYFRESEAITIRIANLARSLTKYGGVSAILLRACGIMRASGI